jgi:hypothetical protein
VAVSIEVGADQPEGRSGAGARNDRCAESAVSFAGKNGNRLVDTRGVSADRDIHIAVAIKIV